MADENATTERDEFWESVYIPINENHAEDGTPPANPVTVADRFLEAAAPAARLAAEAEDISERIADYERRLGAVRRDIAKIRRTILARNFDSVKASWGSEVLDAFILAQADEFQNIEIGKMEQLEGQLLTVIARIQPRLETITRRLKVQTQVMEWAKQYLDFDKLQARIARGRV